MNTANEQTKNSNNDFQNSNLTNPGSKKFTRDYDKEPIVIKDELSNAKFLSIIFLVLCIVALVVIKQFFRSMIWLIAIAVRFLLFHF